MILHEILAAKAKRLAARKQTWPLENVRMRAELTGRDIRSFTRHIRDSKARSSCPALIAEIKRASPSRGLMAGSDYDAGKRARLYEKAGAAAISVLTEEDFFAGSLQDLQKVRQQTDIPLVRKDFVIDEYQLYESYLFGADAILLITAILPAPRLVRFLDISRSLEMDVIVEAHNRTELETAIAAGAQIIGVNNRNLNTFTVDLNTTIELAPMIPGDTVIVSESGFHSRADLFRIAASNIDAILVGEALTRTTDPVQKIRELTGKRGG